MPSSAVPRASEFCEFRVNFFSCSGWTASHKRTNDFKLVLSLGFTHAIFFAGVILNGLAHSLALGDAPPCSGFIQPRNRGLVEGKLHLYHSYGHTTISISEAALSDA
jgi:hypothetical protein